MSASSTTTSATTDQPQAASVPIEISVSIVAAPWRAFSSAARWKPKPAQKTTGVARASASHSQPANWSGGTIASDDERRGERCRDDEPPRSTASARSYWSLRASAASARVIPGRLDRAERGRRPSTDSGSKRTAACSVA